MTRVVSLQRRDALSVIAVWLRVNSEYGHTP